MAPTLQSAPAKERLPWRKRRELPLVRCVCTFFWSMNVQAYRFSKL